MRFGNKVSGITRTLAVAIALLISASAASATNSARYTYSGFAAKDVRLLRQAVDLAVTRLQNENIWRATYANSRYALVTNEAYRGSMLLSANENSWNLLWRQLYYLSLPNDDGDTEPAFPNIKITGIYEAPEKGRGNWLGRAPLDTVQVRMEDGAVRQSGSFTLSLNTYYFGSNEYYSDPNEWAATIAHEMLHNLGHRHDSSTVAYDSLQIIMLDREVKYNGTFVRNSQAKMADSESLEKLSR